MEPGLYRSMPLVIMMISRRGRAGLGCQRLIRSTTEKYGLAAPAELPSGRRTAFAALVWSCVRSCTVSTVPLCIYPTAMNVGGGCCMMKARNSPSWVSTLQEELSSMESELHTPCQCWSILLVLETLTEVWDRKDGGSISTQSANMPLLPRWHFACDMARRQCQASRCAAAVQQGRPSATERKLYRNIPGSSCV